MGISKRTKLDLEDIEHILQASLQPVKPRNDFVRHLRSLLAEPVERLPVVKVDRKHVLIFGLATLVSGILIVFTTGRVLLAFGGAIGLARYLKSQSDLRQLSAQRIAN
jgi:hypothetical protein